MSKVAKIVWLLEWLHELDRVAPKRQWMRAPASASLDQGEVVAAMRLEATRDADAIWLALCEHEAFGRWPKLSGRASYFLRERIQHGILLCETWLLKHDPTRSAIPPARPSDPADAARQLLLTSWATSGVERWLAHNADEFQETHPDEADPLDCQ